MIQWFELLLCKLAYGMNLINDLLLENIGQAKKQFQQVAWSKPQFVAIETITNTQQHQDDIFTEVMGEFHSHKNLSVMWIFLKLRCS